MSDTPRTEAEVKFGLSDPLAGVVTVCADFACRLERELNAAQATIRQQQLLDEEVMRLRERVKRFECIVDGFRREQNDIEQTCGKALGYPRFCNDQKNFPGSTEADGVIIGDHVAASIAAELANKYAEAMERVKRLEEAGDAMCETYEEIGMDSFDRERIDAWKQAKQAKP